MQQVNLVKYAAKLLSALLSNAQAEFTYTYVSKYSDAFNESSDSCVCAIRSLHPRICTEAHTLLSLHGNEIQLEIFSEDGDNLHNYNMDVVCGDFIVISVAQLNTGDQVMLSTDNQIITNVSIRTALKQAILLEIDHHANCIYTTEEHKLYVMQIK